MFSPLHAFSIYYSGQSKRARCGNTVLTLLGKQAIANRVDQNRRRRTWCLFRICSLRRIQQFLHINRQKNGSGRIVNKCGEELMGPNIFVKSSIQPTSYGLITKFSHRVVNLSALNDS